MNSILSLGIFHGNYNNDVSCAEKDDLISLLRVRWQLFKYYSSKSKNDAVQLGSSSHSKGPIRFPGKAIKPQISISIKTVSSAGC